MLRLRDIMTTDLVTISPELNLRDAMAVLAGQHLSGAPVVAGGKVVGVVSATDLMEFMAALPGVPTVRPEADESEDWQVPAGELGDDEIPESYFSELWDNAGADVTTRMNDIEGPEWNALEEHTVGEVMTRSIFALPPGTAVEFAAYRMRAIGVHRVLVMQGDALVGIVTTKDIADAVADHRLTARTFVFPTTRPLAAPAPH
ncbi:MAG: CBS domain-containing protein [Gemmatimonadaceae bacterium]